MQRMQDRVLETLSKAITAKELEPVTNFHFANTGHLYGMDGLATLIDIGFDFQRPHCRLSFTVPGLTLADVGIQDHPPLYRVEDDTIAFHAIDYTDGDRLQGAVLIVATLVDAFRDQVSR